MFHDAENVPQPGRAGLFHDEANVPRKCSTTHKLFHEIVPRRGKCSTTRKKSFDKTKIGVALNKTPVILCYMENNTTQKTSAEIRAEIENIRSQMCGKFAYIGMLDKGFFNLYTKEQLVERLTEIASNAKQLQTQYDQKITEMLNAKS